jgi:micrococcal nuclease
MTISKATGPRTTPPQANVHRPARRPLPPHIVIPPFYRRRPLASALVVILLLGAVADRVGGRRQGDDCTRYHDRVFTVVHVLDGDTFDIDLPDGHYPTTRIRLWGVDTPEVAGSKAGEMYYGPQASTFAKQTLASKPVRLELSPTKTRDLYGRLLAYVYLLPEGDCFNELLLDQGYAYADWRFTHPLKDRYKTLEQRARRRGVGLWAGVKFEQMPAWRQRMEKALEAKETIRPGEITLPRED